MKRPSCLETVGWLILALIVVGLLFPAMSGPHTSSKKAEARAAAVGIHAALKEYMIEYGRWPDYTGDGRFVDASRNAQLMHTLCARDEKNNPRKIPFFEARTASKVGWFGNTYASGFHPGTGAFLDPWGNPYLISLDSDFDGKVANPYPGEPEIPLDIIVWSLGRTANWARPTMLKTTKCRTMW